jgi:hypothetical protein
MYVQLLTFRVVAGERDDASYFCARAALGLAEFDGYISDTCLTKPGHDTFGGMIAWRDWTSLDAFRHSELYARLMMSPYFEGVDDRAFGIAERQEPVARQAELLAVA